MGSKKNNILGNIYSDEWYTSKEIVEFMYKLLNIKSVEREIDYSKFPKNSLLYFDPPYSNTTKYHSEFDNVKFWELVDTLSKDFIVLVSEFNAPNDYISIWSKEKLSTVNSDGKYKKDMEHLFIHKNNLKYINREEI